MAERMQQRRGTSEQWTLVDPILASGEVGYETDTNKFKIGNGIDNWSTLSYFLDENAIGGSLSDYVLASTLGQPNGVATLDVTGNVPASQLNGYATTESPTFTGLTDFQGVVDFSDAMVVGIDALPIQTGNAGKYLTTDGINASWADPTPHPFAMMG